MVNMSLEKPDVFRFPETTFISSVLQHFLDKCYRNITVTSYKIHLPLFVGSFVTLVGIISIFTHESFSKIYLTDLIY